MHWRTIAFVFWRAFWLFLAVNATACHSKNDTGKRTPELQASSVAAALGVDADLPPPADPTPPSGDLASDVAKFSTLDACVAEHGKVDPLVGDALLSFGYDTFLRDACRQIDAVKSRDSDRCDSIVASELRAHCIETFAMVTGAPDMCPFPSSDNPHGRMPTCVAVAAHDPRLCAAESAARRPTCAAIANRDPSKCDSLSQIEIGNCRRISERLRSSIAPPRSDLPPLPAPSGKLELHALTGTQSSNPDSIALGDDVSEGVALTIGNVETSFAFGASHDDAAFPHAVLPESKLRIGFEMHVTNTPANEARLRSVSVEVPGGVRLDTAQLRGSPRVQITLFSKERGGALAFTVDGEIGTPPQAFTFHLEVKTFVRDVVSLARPQ